MVETVKALRKLHRCMEARSESAAAVETPKRKVRRVWRCVAFTAHGTHTSEHTHNDDRAKRTTL